jgi:hypothetical protein
MGGGVAAAANDLGANAATDEESIPRPKSSVNPTNNRQDCNDRCRCRPASGTSRAPDSLLVSTRPLNTITVHDWAITGGRRLHLAHAYRAVTSSGEHALMLEAPSKDRPAELRGVRTVSALDKLMIYHVLVHHLMVRA